MKIQLDDTGGRYAITAYVPGQVSINRAIYTRSLIVSPDRLIADWAPADLSGLAREHLDALLALVPEVVLLGTGHSLRFPHPSLLEGLVRAGIGHEIMDTGAACRTYNVLMGEGRRVVAGLLIEPATRQTE